MSFESRIRGEMVRGKEDWNAVELVDCKVKAVSRYCGDEDEFEVVAANHTKVHSCEKEFEIPSNMKGSDSGTATYLDELSEIDNMGWISVSLCSPK